MAPKKPNPFAKKGGMPMKGDMPFPPKKGAKSPFPPKKK